MLSLALAGPHPRGRGATRTAHPGQLAECARIPPPPSPTPFFSFELRVKIQDGIFIPWAESLYSTRSYARVLEPGFEYSQYSDCLATPGGLPVACTRAPVFTARLLCCSGFASSSFSARHARVLNGRRLQRPEPRAGATRSGVPLRACACPLRLPHCACACACACAAAFACAAACALAAAFALAWPSACGCPFVCAGRCTCAAAWAVLADAAAVFAFGPAAACDWAWDSA